MCLSIPSKIKSINSDTNTAVVETMGVSREVSLDLMDINEISIGDFVLIHIGFAMNKIDEQDALESLKVYDEILSLMDEKQKAEAIGN